MGIGLDFFLLIAGIVLLVWAGDILVRGAAALARHWGVPALIVGLTIVAFGTSAPELVVSVQAVLGDASGLASSNVVGSNIANVLLAIGLPALIISIPTNMAGVGRNSLIALGATSAVVVMCLVGTPLERWQGALLFAGIVAYLLYMFALARRGVDDPILEEMSELDEGESGLPKSVWMDLLFVVGGIAGLLFGGNLIVESAKDIALAIGLSEAVIGLTIVALGTSLPEIATVLVAAFRKQADVALGNVLGSNIFNSFAVLGAAALTGPVSVDPEVVRLDIWVMLAATLFLTGYVFTRNPVGRKTGLDSCSPMSCSWRWWPRGCWARDLRGREGFPVRGRASLRRRIGRGRARAHPRPQLRRHGAHHGRPARRDGLDTRFVEDRPHPPGPRGRRARPRHAQRRSRPGAPGHGADRALGVRAATRRASRPRHGGNPPTHAR